MYLAMSSKGGSIERIEAIVGTLCLSNLLLPLVVISFESRCLRPLLSNTTCPLPSCLLHSVQIRHLTYIPTRADRKRKLRLGGGKVGAGIISVDQSWRNRLNVKNVAFCSGIADGARLIIDEPKPEYSQGDI